MERALVVVDSTENARELLREAGELAAGVGAELVLFSPLSTDELEDDLETLESISRVERVEYGERTVVDSAAGAAEELGDDLLSDLDVEYAGTAAVYDDEKATAILDAAERHRCDHLFVGGRKRSPTGKVVFGDTTQQVLLNFDGRVTVSLE